MIVNLASSRRRAGRQAARSPGGRSGPPPFKSRDRDGRFQLHAQPWLPAYRLLRASWAVADPAFAASAHLELAAAGHARHVGVMLFPELGLSSYAIDDLLLQAALLDRAEAAVEEIVAASRDLYPVLVVGAPPR